MKNRILLFPVTLVGVLGLSSCSGEIPTNASAAEFCSLTQELEDGLNQWDDKGDKEKVDEFVDKARDVGVPSNMPSEVQEAYSKGVAALDENEGYDDYSAAIDAMDDVDLDSVDDYITRVC